MNRYLTSTLVFACALAIAACSNDGNPNDPDKVPDVATFNLELSPRNESPIINDAGSDAAVSGTLVLNVTHKGDDISSATADVTLSFTRFPAGTVVTMAHVHEGVPGVNGDVLLPTDLAARPITLTGPDASFIQTGIAVDGATARRLLEHPMQYYFDVHSTQYPNGVARGQLIPRVYEH
jgi:hypothetical protein